MKSAILDEVAFQTNMLALNAAVEATRVGELSPGVASIASDLRDLASRSANSVQDIKVLIKNNKNSVDDGMDMMDRTSKSFDKIADMVNEVAARVSQIDSIGKDQAASVGDVLQTVVLLNQITQKNTVLVEQTSVHSIAMKEQSQKLTEQISFFYNGLPSKMHSSLEHVVESESFDIATDTVNEKGESKRQENLWKGY